MDDMLGFQIHGKKLPGFVNSSVSLIRNLGMRVTFYIMQLLYEGCYTFTQIDWLDFPASIDTLHTFTSLPNMNNLIKMSRIFWSNCKKTKNLGLLRSFYRPTFRQLVEGDIPRKGHPDRY